MINYDDKTISFIHRITKKDLSIISHIYNNYILDKSLKKITFSDKITTDNIKAYAQYTKTFKNIYQDLKQNRNKLVMSSLLEIDDKYMKFVEFVNNYENQLNKKLK